MKQKLLELGSNTIGVLPKFFRCMQSNDGQGHLHASEFFHVLKGCGLNIIKEEIVLLLRFFDPNGVEQIDYEKFLFALRGSLNAERQAAVDYVFSRFDRNNEGLARAEDLKAVFNYVKHPKFTSGKLTGDQIFCLYLKNFNNALQPVVTKKEWDDYYTGLSVAIDDDSHFIYLIKDQFKVE